MPHRRLGAWRKAVKRQRRHIRRCCHLCREPSALRHAAAGEVLLVVVLVSTFGDELAIHTAARAKVFGVSVKDRGAVAMAGHVGKAFWFSKQSGGFVTSSFYYEQYPEWVNEWNAGHLCTLASEEFGRLLLCIVADRLQTAPQRRGRNVERHQLETVLFVKRIDKRV